MLERAGHRVHVASDEAAAILAVPSGTDDIVPKNVWMPDNDGLTPMRHIRSVPHSMCDDPILAMTANVLPRQIEQVWDAGMNDHVGKPFKREELYSAVERCGRRPLPPAALFSPRDAIAVTD